MITLDQSPRTQQPNPEPTQHIRHQETGAQEPRTQEPIAQEQIALAALNRAEQRQAENERERPRSPTGQRQRSASVPRDAHKRICWSIKSNTNGSNRCDLVRMVCEMMNTYGAAKNWPVGSDIFDGESPTVTEHIKAKGWLQDHIPSWCEKAIKARGSRELKKCPPNGFYSSSRDSTKVSLENA